MLGMGLGLTRQQRLGVPVLDPLTLSPTLWLKADAGTYQASGGSVATADGDPVGQWQDQSGSGNHVAQATGSLKGTLKLAVQNGLPGIRFDGVDDLLVGPAISNLIAAGAYTLFAVFKAAAVNTNAANSWENDCVVADEHGYWGLHLRSAPEMRAFNYAAADDNVSLGISLGAATLATQRHESGVLYLSKDGGAESSISSGNTGSLTGPFQLGRCSAAHLDGDLHEIIICNSNKTAPEIAACNAYLMTRWGIS